MTPEQIDAAAEAYGRPERVEADDLMDAPEGTERVGDEFHNPDYWKTCERCGIDSPVDYEVCFKCRHPFDPDSVFDPAEGGDA